MLHTAAMPRFSIRIIAVAVLTTLLLFVLASRSALDGSSWSAAFYQRLSHGIYAAHLSSRAATPNMVHILNRTLGVSLCLLPQ